jgi:hypothetical protein
MSENLLSIVPIEPHIPPSFVVKWVDYTNRFGFSIETSNGTRTVLFNDNSSLSMSASGKEFSYKQGLNDEPTEWSSSDFIYRYGPIREKVNILDYLKGMTQCPMYILYCIPFRIS